MRKVALSTVKIGTLFKVLRSIELLNEKKGGAYITTIANSTDVTFSHIHGMLRTLDAKKLIKSEPKKGRIILITLTARGRKVLEVLKQIGGKE